MREFIVYLGCKKVEINEEEKINWKKWGWGYKIKRKGRKRGVKISLELLNRRIKF